MSLIVQTWYSNPSERTCLIKFCPIKFLEVLIPSALDARSVFMATSILGDILPFLSFLKLTNQIVLNCGARVLRSNKTCGLKQMMTI